MKARLDIQVEIEGDSYEAIATAVGKVRTALFGLGSNISIKDWREKPLAVRTPRAPKPAATGQTA